MEAFKTKGATWEAKEGGADAPAQLQKVADAAAAVSAADDEPTGVENVRYEAVANQGAPERPATAALAQRQALTSGSTERFGGEVGELDDEDVDSSSSDRKIKTLQDMIDRLESPETVEERKRRERRERSSRIISAIGDGLQAMSNLFFTSQYAPNMYSPEKSSQLNVYNAALERARKDREANADRYYRLSLALGDAENERAAAIERREQQKAAAAAAKAEAEAGRRFKAGEAEKDRRNKREIAEAQEEGRNRRNKENNEFKAKEGEKNRNSTHPREFRSYDRYGRERWFEDQDAADDFYGQEDYERRLAEWIAGGRVGERPQIDPNANRLEGTVETQSVKPKYNDRGKKVGMDTTVTSKPEKVRVPPSRHVNESKGKGYGDGGKGKGY